MTEGDYNKSVDKYSDGLYRFILKSIGDKEMASDIVQESYEKLWMKIENISAEKVKSYLFSTAYHTMIDMIRREKRMQAYENSLKPESSHSQQYNDLQEILHHALGKLPEIQRSVILLRDYEGYSYHEIGEICSLSESQVKVYIYRARLFLKNYIGSLQAVI